MQSSITYVSHAKPIVFMPFLTISTDSSFGRFWADLTSTQVSVLVCHGATEAATRPYHEFMYFDAGLTRIYLIYHSVGTD